MTAYPTWLEIDLGAVAHNTRTMRELAGVPLMAVVKGNAYGFGALEVSRCALAHGASWLSVARYGEARPLRQAGITAPLLVFGYTTPDEVDEAIAGDVTLTLHSFASAEVYACRARAAGKSVRAHLKVDTGLHRLGIQPAEVVGLAQHAHRLGGIVLDGVYSHLAMVDEGDFPETAQQTRVFGEVLQALAQAGFRPEWVHLAGSSAATYNPETRFNLVRIGCALVGIPPRSGTPLLPSLRSAITWKARLADCRTLPGGTRIGYGLTYTTPGEEIIGVLPVGYIDGFRRLPGNQVLIGGQRAPVIAKMCMDMCMLRLPRAFPAGSEVVLLGSQGQEHITIEELAQRWHASEVDALGNINARVPRVYINYCENNPSLST
jgi:alanine racemase